MIYLGGACRRCSSFHHSLCAGEQGSPALDPPLWVQLIKLARLPCSEAIIRGVSRQVATASAVPSYVRDQGFGPQPDLGLREASLVWVMSLPHRGGGSPLKFNSY